LWSFIPNRHFLPVGEISQVDFLAWSSVNGLNNITMKKEEA
jgi:hypothetical protein